MGGPPPLLHGVGRIRFAGEYGVEELRRHTARSETMIKHVVLIKFKPEVTEDQVDDVERSLDALPGAIPEILSYDFGRDVVHSERSFDFGLVSSFSDLEALERYEEHPDHQAVLGKLKSLCDQIIVVDFTF
jgi:quinol monooxygenase YgiN